MILSGEVSGKMNRMCCWGGKLFWGLFLTEVVGLTVITNHFLCLCSK